MKFTHLHTHSHYSLLDGLPKIDELIDYVKELGMDSVALTDHGVMYGAVEFYKKAKAKGIKPIIGCEVYMSYEGHKDKRPNIDAKSYHMILLVKNQKGYENLVKLVTIAHLDGYYYKPRIDEELLEKYAPGLIGTSACLNGKIPKLLLANRFDDAKDLALKYQKLFGADSFYLELQEHKNIPEQAVLNKKIIELHEKTGIPLVATNDIHYLRPEDAEAQDVLMLINTGADINDSERLSLKSDDFSMLSPEKMAEIWKEWPEAIENTHKIADLCNFELELGKIQLPHFEVPGGKSAEEYLTELCKAGLEKRYPGAVTKQITDRMNYELSVINKTGFAGYILIVQDFVNWAKSHRIVVGPGRGSAGGSLVCYLTNITNVDPIKHDLLFERFLNPERISMPDIDMDFTDRRRDEVIKYVGEKYGHDHVAQIITFGTMAARAVLRDVGRALQYTYSYCDALAKMVPFGMDLNETLEKVTEFKDLYKHDPQGKRLIDLALKLEGVARHASTHACGVVISAKPLTDSVPLQHPPGQDDSIITQYEMHSIEDLGLLKMDFLGLKNLTIIEDTLARIYVIRGEKVDMEKIPFDDKKTYKLLQDAITTSVFQLEGDGMKRYLKELKPTEFEDIVAMVALYRPGPMQFIPDYIERKHGRQKIYYIHPALQPILKETQGICLTGDSTIQTANPGGIETIEKLVTSKKLTTVQSFDVEKNNFTKSRIINTFDNGVKDVYEIKLWTGKKIRATQDHQFLTPDGFKKVKELNIGQFLATPKKLFLGKTKFRKGKIKILAYLLADGAMTSGTSCYFVNKNTRLISDFKKSAESSFKNIKIKITKHIRDVYRAVPGKENKSGKLYHTPNNILDWLRSLHLKDKNGGKNSSEKFIPLFIYELNESLITTFLATYWDCDGGITPQTAYLKTISEKIAYGVQTLLLKLGINSHIYQNHEYRGRKGKKTKVYQINVYDLENFYKKVGINMLTKKGEFLKKSLQQKRGVGIYREFVPRKKFFEKLNDYLLKNNITQRQICETFKIGRKGFFGLKDRTKNRLTLIIAKKIADFLDDKELKEICSTENIRWENIISIDYVGKERVFDVEIKGTHTFVANNIISHNCIYQEQLMKIAQVIAGFTLGEADILRKAVGKKIKELLDAQEGKFISGAIKNGVDKKIAEELWQWILPFANYGFPKAHAAAYATIAYQTAYLKTHYPVEFMASVLTSEKADVERIALLIEECKKMDIEVLPPNINESLKNFTVVPGQNKIRFGLLAIKNVGVGIIDATTQEIKKAGPFTSIGDFISRVNSKDLNKKSMEALIKAGAFDAFNERNQLLQNLEKLLEIARESQKNKSNGQIGLFASAPATIKTEIKLAMVEPAHLLEKLTWEKELLGLYVSSHPLNSFRKLFEKKTVAIASIDKTMVDKKIIVGGLISNVKKIITKNGKPMIFMKLEDLTGKGEVVVFPNLLEAKPEILKENKIVFVAGRVDSRNGEVKIVADDVQEIITPREA